MFISFIIIAESFDKIKIDLNNLKDILKEKNITSEILLVYGINPSRQRNHGANVAHGEWLYFLDNDSVLDQFTIDQFLITIRKFKDANVIGGPSVLPNPSSEWQQAVQCVFSSDFGVGPLKSRYFSNGQIRESSEKEMILCNMAIKKEVFTALNGFNENLYPNEENEFLGRMNNVGQIIYSPLVIVYRQHRKNAIEFLLQMTGYGKGRTRHFLFSNEYTEFIYFLPLISILMFSFAFFNSTLKIYLMTILSGYVLVLGLQSLFVTLKTKNINLFILTLLAFIVCHVGYALGLFIGFFDHKNRINGEIVVKNYFSSTQVF